MVVVGLTGGIGCGKSTVAALLAARGAVVIDADQIARQVVAPTGASYQALVDHFGPAVVTADGTIDRAAVAARVFADPAELTTLNAITHPAIAAATGARLAELSNTERLFSGTESTVVLEIPLLNESTRMVYPLAAVVVVDAPVELAIRRLVQQRGLTEADAQARVRAQPSRQERRRMADAVVDNSGSRAELERSVERLWEWMASLVGTRGRATSVDRPAQEASSADGAKEGQEDQ